MTDDNPLPPLNEASTRKLYKWADRMVVIMDLMIASRDVANDGMKGDIALSLLAQALGEQADQAFIDDFYDLFKQLSNRKSGA